ncbi:MAG TPA: VOC family protein [Nitrospirales bacterium]|nr:VOC family protein [Nitrospirales bacterium]HIC04788.1 VOC family protein [Nitrospirales bacterium]HIN33195.1 VOC family protein [Nitrospirales bacterium]HIO21491.1 VOC family protein [Nitrospirales bacterium]
MPVELDHTIITMKNVDEATAFYAKILGMKFEGKMGDFSIMRVTASLTLDFEEAEPGETIERGHFAFAMTADEFDAAFERIKASGIPYGEGPGKSENMRGPGMTQGARGMGKAVYFRDPTGHMLEIKTYDSG